MLLRSRLLTLCRDRRRRTASRRIRLAKHQACNSRARRIMASCVLSACRLYDSLAVPTTQQKRLGAPRSCHVVLYFRHPVRVVPGLGLNLALPGSKMHTRLNFAPRMRYVWVPDVKHFHPGPRSKQHLFECLGVAGGAESLGVVHTMIH